MDKKLGTLHRKSTAVLAFVLMLCMITAALFWGAHKGWAAERQLVESGMAQVEEMLQARRAAGANVLAVAKRHLPGSDPLIQNVKSAMDVIAGRGGIAMKSQASLQLNRDARLLLDQLAKLPTVSADSRDSMYVGQLLPQELEQSAAGTWQAEYNLRVEEFNSRLDGSFSGFLARILGAPRAERLAVEAE